MICADRTPARRPESLIWTQHERGAWAYVANWGLSEGAPTDVNRLARLRRINMWSSVHSRVWGLVDRLATVGDRFGAPDDEVSAAASVRVAAGVNAAAAASVDGAAAAPIRRLEQIVREQSVPLARALALVVLDRQVAADIAQETFLRLYMHWDEVAKHPDLTAWLYRVAFNRAKDHRRALARAARTLERLKAGAAAHATQVGSAPPWEPDPDFIGVFRSLPRQQRTAVVLHYVGDLTVSQTARVMRISEGAAKSHLHRAHQTLRELLEGM